MRIRNLPLGFGVPRNQPTPSWPISSDTFCLPVEVKLSPQHSLTAAIIALHCLPLPLLVMTVDVVGTVGAGLIAAITGISLGFELRKQRFAAAVTKLEGRTSGEWQLHRGAERSMVQLLDKVDCRRFVLLLMAKDGRKFRLVVKRKDQPRDQLHQLHRLRVLLRHRQPQF